MASKKDIADQLELTQKLSASTEAMARTLEKIEASYATQVSTVEKLTKVLEQLSKINLDNLDESKIESLGKKAEEAEKQTNTLSASLTKTANVISKKLTPGLGFAAGALSGLYQGFRNVVSIGKGVFSLFGTLISGAFGVGKALLQIPLRMFSSLIGTAGAAGGSTELATALNNLRIEFGDLKGPTNSAILSVATTMKGFSAGGMSAFQVYGNLAERIKKLQDVAHGMGATFGLFTEEFKENGGALLNYQNGLGITMEEMRGFGAAAKVSGKSLESVLRETTKLSTGLGDAFGLDAKLISKDMSKALNDVKHFAGATTKQIAQASVYSRKLGLELHNIVGTLDAFETFDQAADNASKLSQAFGANIDAFKMMQAQSPDEQVDMLRKSLFAAGKSADQMSRQELKLLAQTTGLDEATAKLAFSQKNQGLSLDQIKKKGSETEKKTLTQAEAMDKLANALERMIKQGESHGGFWDAFTTGLLRGFQSGKDFRGLMQDLKMDLQNTMFAGVEIGRVLADTFPGIKDFFGGLREFFNPKTFKQFLGANVTIFKDWMKEFTSGKADFGDLLDKIQKNFFDFFSSKTTAGQKTLNGMKDFLLSVSKIVGSGISWMGKKVKEGVQYLIDIITGKQKLGVPGVGAATGFMGDLISPLLDGVTSAFMDVKDSVWELLKVSLKTLWNKTIDYVTSKEFQDDFAKGIEKIKPALVGLMGTFFGPIIGQSLLGAITAAIGVAAVGAIKNLGGDVFSKITKALEDKLSATKSKTPTNVSTITETATKGGDVVNATKDWGAKDAVGLGLKLVALAGALSIGGIMLAKAVVVISEMLSGVKATDIVTSLAVIGSVAVASVPMMFSLKLAEGFTPATILKGGLAISAAVGMAGLVGGGIVLMMKKIGASPELIKASGDMMVSMGEVFVMMIPILAAATALGVAIAGSMGLAGGAAAAGMAAISLSVGSMAKSVVDVMKSLAGLTIDNDFKLKSDVFISILRIVNDFTKTLVDLIGQMGPSIAGIFSKDTTTFKEKIEGSKGLIQDLIGSKEKKSGILGFVDSIKDSLASLPTLDAKSAQAFSSVLTAISSVMDALTPSPELISSFKKKETKQISGVGKAIAEEFDVGAYTKSIELLGKTFSPLITQLTSGIMSSLATEVKKFDEKDIEVVKLLPDILNSVTNTFSKILDFGKNGAAMGPPLPPGPWKPDIPTPEQITSIDVAIGSFTKNVEPLFKKIIDVVSGIKLDSTISSKVKIFKDIMDTVTSVANALIQTTDKKVDWDKIKINDFIANLTTSLPENKDTYANFNNRAKLLLNSGIEQSLKATKDMIDNVNKMSDSLSKTTAINLPALLKPLADGVGLGGKYDYTIKNKEVVINVNFDISMNVDDVEKVMILRKKSIIRDRLNVALGSDTSAKIPSTKSSPVTLMNKE